MKSLFLLSFLYLVLPLATAQFTTEIPSTPTTTASLTPVQSLSSTNAGFFAMSTSVPLQPGSPDPGDVGSSPGSGDSIAGAAGTDNGSISISRGGIIAIIIVAVSVCVLGIVSAVLFYLAKKRSWKIRESIRRSARKVATALTPRRTTFPKDVHKKRSTKGLTKIEEDPSPRRARDVEKGTPKFTFDMVEPPSNESKWARKFGR